MTTSAASKFSAMSTKLQVGTAAVAVAAAASITPAVAHAAPSLAPFSQNVGNAAQLLIDPTVILPGSNKKAAAVPSASATSDPSPIEIFVDGLGQGLSHVIQGTVQFWGSFVYGGLAFTGTILNIFGPNPVGDFFLTAANNVAIAIHIGPYNTSA